MLSKRRGFTLIELLVSISIIAILTALLTANFIGARQRGRDGQRKANLYQIQSALELYRSDKGVYPVTGSFPACGTCLSPTGTCTASDTIYMQKVPCDPLGSNVSYKYTSDGSTFTLFACLENQQDSDVDKDPNDIANITGCSATTFPFKLTNP